MSVKIIVTWASEADMIKDATFAKTRRTKLKEMTQAGKTDGVASYEAGTGIASIVFVDQASAEEWKTFIQNLATTYNKTILSIVIE